MSVNYPFSCFCLGTSDNKSLNKVGFSVASTTGGTHQQLSWKETLLGAAPNSGLSDYRQYGMQHLSNPLMNHILLDGLRQHLAHLVTQSSTSSAGSNTHTNTSNSLSGFLSTLIPVAAEAALFFGIFLVMRTKKQRVYQPRTYLSTLRDQ